MKLKLSKSNLIQPVLKWVGGKRQLADEIRPLIPKRFSTYIEPFVGGAAILFDLQPKNAVVNDINAELINVYRVIANSVDDLIQRLEEHKASTSEDYFYSIRELDRQSSYNNLSDIERAARIIYLNKTCYNGLYRVNSSGQFNSPYGRYTNPAIVNEPILRAVSHYFNHNNVKLLCGDYEAALREIKKGSFVYFDPPYVPISSSASFTGYTESGFDLKAQENLKAQCDELNNKSVKFLLSNSDCEFIRELYKDYKIITVKAKRAINSKAHLRGEINEVLVKNYD